jgi:tyrosyl-tRNA synthetase
VTVAKREFGKGISLVDALVLVKLANSKSDARRGIQARGYYINGAQVSNVVDQVLGVDQLERDEDGTEYIILRKGKKTHVALVVAPS